MRPEAYGERRERETQLSVAQGRYGFDPAVAVRLTFIRWLVATERLTEGLPGGARQGRLSGVRCSGGFWSGSAETGGVLSDPSFGHGC
jgi:hypothetical protein